jgi:hypothetical protein
MAIPPHEPHYRINMPTTTLTCSPSNGQKWSDLLHMPLDLVISRIVPLLIHHDSLGLIAQVSKDGNELADVPNMWLICSKQRGWLDEFQTKTEFRNALCSLTPREKTRRCDFTTMKQPLLSYYHPKQLYRVRHIDICIQCQTAGTNRFNRNYYAFISNVRLCRHCYVRGRRSKQISDSLIEYNIISQKECQKSYLVTKKSLVLIPCGTATLMMGSKANLYSERVAQSLGWKRFGNETKFVAEVIKRQQSAELKAKEKNTSKKKLKIGNGFERPVKNYQHSNALQLTHLLESGCTDSNPPPFNMYRLDDGDFGYGENADGCVLVGGL